MTGPKYTPGPKSKKEQECNNKVPVVIICGPFKKYGTPPVKEGTRMQ